jgi:hypothetical protein
LEEPDASILVVEEDGSPETWAPIFQIRAPAKFFAK